MSDAKTLNLAIRQAEQRIADAMGNKLLRGASTETRLRLEALAAARGQSVGDLLLGEIGIKVARELAASCEKELADHAAAEKAAEEKAAAERRAHAEREREAEAARKARENGAQKTA